MKPYEKTFRNSIFGIFPLMFYFLFITFFAIIVFVSDSEIYLRVIAGVIWAALTFAVLYFLFHFPRSVKVTDDEITIRKLIGTKSLRWDEIERVSVNGPYLRLHRREGNATLSISSQMNGYAELLDLFFKKHSKLFKMVESEFISQGKYGGSFVLVLVLLFIGMGIYSFRESNWILGIFYFGCGIFALFNWPRIPTVFPGWKIHFS